MCLFANNHEAKANGKQYNPAEIRALYLSTNNIYNKKKIAELEGILKTTKANGIVIDFKDSNALPQQYMISLAKRFRDAGAYTIARIVVFQDSYFAPKHSEIAVKTGSGSFWWSGRKIWKRYWLDPASLRVQNYTIEVAKHAIDAGFDEIQFDYIRFPTDGNMRDIHFPIFDSTKETKSEAMTRFFKKLREELKTYSPDTFLAIDVFGEVLLYGREQGIGQDLVEIAKYFDVISPMAYPSHYKCREFKVKDPNAHPYLVYQGTIRNGLKFLGGIDVIVRPWVQSFTLRNIYGCGSTIVYDETKVKAQIQASRDQGVHGFMLWNVMSVFPKGVFY